jgi:hypothetical protein
MVPVSCSHFIIGGGEEGGYIVHKSINHRPVCLVKRKQNWKQNCDTVDRVLRVRKLGTFLPPSIDEKIESKKSN